MSQERIASQIPTTIGLATTGANTTRRLIALSKLRKAQRLAKILADKKGIIGGSDDKIDTIGKKIFGKLRDLPVEQEEQNSHLNDLMEQANQQQKDIEQTSKGVDDSFNTNEEAPSEDFAPQPTDEPTDESIAETTQKASDDVDDLSKAVSTTDDAVSDASNVAKTTGQILEDTAVSDELGGGEFDPIQDIISGALAIGGSIASALALDKKPKAPAPEPTINVQQGMAGAEA